MSEALRNHGDHCIFFLFKKKNINRKKYNSNYTSITLIDVGGILSKFAVKVDNTTKCINNNTK